MVYSLVKKGSVAVVIPAYKSIYLADALLSLAEQTNKNFTVYIGDDASPHGLEAIVSGFTDRLSIVYKKFEVNLGGGDLVAQWERCVDMVRDEEWVWFFSDDDRLDSNCMEQLHQYLSQAPEVDLLHFNVRIINGQGRLEAWSGKDFPEHCSAEDFARDRLKNKLQSFMVEFVFRRSYFEAVGRFQNFDLAWGSDVATCIKLAHPRGIVTLPGANVFWRRSEYNISPDESTEMVRRKMGALVDWFDWLRSFESDMKVKVYVSPFVIYMRRWLGFRGRNGLLKTCLELRRVLGLKFY